MRIERNLKLIGFFTVCGSMLFLIPVILPYYSEVIGLGYREFLYGETAYAAAIVLFDVPTGWISDVWKRKHTLALGYILNMIGWCILLIAHSLWQAILAQTFLGLCYSLLSGSNTALLYDSLLSVDRKNEYRKKEGKRMALSLYAIAGASVVGGFLYSINRYLPIYTTLIANFIALIAVLMIDEPERHKRIGQKHPVADIIETIKYALHGHAEVGFIIIFTAVLFCSTKLIMISQQPYYMALNFPKAAFGILIAVGFFLGGASSHWAHLLDGKINTFRALMFAWALAFFVCVGAGLHIGLSGVALLMVGGSCIYGAAAPRVNEAINRLVGSERRATILSTLSFMTSLLAIPMSALIGWISGIGGVQLSLFGIALWLCLSGACLVAWKMGRTQAT